MKARTKNDILRELRRIPGVGKSIALDLWSLGIRSTAELRRKNPETLYTQFCRKVGQPVDRCLLYEFRCAVYFSSHRKHDPRLLLWWNWKDKDAARR